MNKYENFSCENVLIGHYVLIKYPSTVLFSVNKCNFFTEAPLVVGESWITLGEPVELLSAHRSRSCGWGS